MTRRSRTFAALLAVFALVFAQFAVAAHACATHGAAIKAEVMAHHDCGGAMDGDEAPATDSVCLEHCQYGDASLDSGQAPGAIADAAGPALRIDVIEPSAIAAAVRASWRFVPAAAPPPPSILFGVLRI